VRTLIYPVLVLLFVLSAGLEVTAQSGTLPSKTSPSDVASAIRSSAAYAEVLVIRTDLEANLESLRADYTEEFPKVREIRIQLDLIKKETDRLFATKSSDTSRLTQALGKLMVRKVELESDLLSLQQQYKDGHPDVVKAKRKVEIYENAIKEILGS
jgi:hypothetical protein